MHSEVSSSASRPQAWVLWRSRPRLHVRSSRQLSPLSPLTPHPISISAYHSTYLVGSQQNCANRSLSLWHARESTVFATRAITLFRLHSLYRLHHISIGVRFELTKTSALSARWQVQPANFYLQIIYDAENTPYFSSELQSVVRRIFQVDEQAAWVPAAHSPSCIYSPIMSTTSSTKLEQQIAGSTSVPHALEQVNEMSRNVTRFWPMRTLKCCSSTIASYEVLFASYYSTSQRYILLITLLAQQRGFYS